MVKFIFLRDQEIDRFVPEPYWTIEANLSYKTHIIKAFHDKNPFIKEKELEAKFIHQKIKNEKIAVILSNSKNTNIEYG